MVSTRESLIILMACAQLALSKPRWGMGRGEKDRRSALRMSPDALKGVPAGYGDVPKLGPPLPGDLGKPILEQQQSALAQAANADRERQEQAAAAERERRSKELRTARQSALLVQASRGSAVRPWERVSQPYPA